MNQNTMVALIAVGLTAIAFARPGVAGSDVEPTGDSATIQLLTPDPSSSATIHCSCSEICLPFVGCQCLLGQRADKDVVFVLPEGYVRGKFSSEVQPHGVNAGGSVDWLTSDPHDARVRLHCWADAFSNSDVTVSGVTATREHQ